MVSFEGELGAGEEQFPFAFMESIVKSKLLRLGMVFIFFDAAVLVLFDVFC